MILVVALSACAPRGKVILYPGAGEIGHLRSVFVGTTRAVDAAGHPGAGRDPVLHFSRYDISIPPAHTPGVMEWPRGAPDPAAHFLTDRQKDFADRAAFQSGLAQELATRPRGERTVLVFVHGYNNNFAEGLYRFAQLTTDLGLPEVAVHYSWPSKGNPLGYGYDRDSMLFARDGLEELLGAVVQSGAEGFILVGHSMGSLLAMETLRQIEIGRNARVKRAIRGVALISPDIDIDLFLQQSRRIGALPQPFAVFVSRRDLLLRLSARVMGQTSRLGNIENVNALAQLDVLVIDVSALSEGGAGHFTAGVSPTFIRLVQHLRALDAAFARDPATRPGLIPGTVLTIQNLTEVVLSGSTPSAP